MADVRESFATLEDFSTGAGLPLHKVLEGDAAASKNASAALVAKDPSNNLKYLEINADGELKVSSESLASCLSGTGSVAGSATWVKVASITLQANTVYQNLGWIVNCLRTAEYKFVAVEDVGVTDVETDITEGIVVGPGDYNDSEQLKCLKFTSGSTGVLELQLQAQAIGSVLSDYRGTITAEEVQ